MKFFRFVSTLIFTFCFFIFSAQTIFANTKVQIPQDADFWSDFPHEDLADFLVENMNNDELLAQILMCVNKEKRNGVAVPFLYNFILPSMQQSRSR